MVCRADVVRTLDRFAVSAGTVGWVYRYRNREAARTTGWVSSGLELSVQLAGEWLHEGRWGGTRRVGPRECFAISPGETYAHSHQATGGRAGVQVGFLLLSEEHPAMRDEAGELRWTPGLRAERRLLDLAAYVREANDAGRAPEASVVEPALAEITARHCELVPRDGVLRAKREIDRSYASPLYMRHFAEIAGMNETTFGRHYLSRFGLSPVRYRLLVRMNAAARLVASGASYRCTDIARQVGFEDESFFFRTFRAVTGLTPQRYAERVREDPEDVAAAASLGVDRARP